MQKKIIISLIVLIALIVGTILLLFISNNNRDVSLPSEYKKYNEVIIAISDKDSPRYSLWSMPIELIAITGLFGCAVVASKRPPSPTSKTMISISLKEK